MFLEFNRKTAVVYGGAFDDIWRQYAVACPLLKFDFQYTTGAGNNGCISRTRLCRGYHHIPRLLFGMIMKIDGYMFVNGL